MKNKIKFRHLDSWSEVLALIYVNMCYYLMQSILQTI